MSEFHYKQLQGWEKSKLERLIGNKPICKPIYGMIGHEWSIVSYEWLVDINELSFKLGRTRKTIKNELLRGSYWTLVNKVEDKSTTLNYSKGASDTRHKKMVSSRNLQHTKIVVNKKLKEFVLNLIKNQSLKGIGGRTRIAYKQGLIETTISPTTLYSYIDNIHVEFINYSSLKRRKKHYYRMKYKGKRQNGISIDERPQSINNRTEFGHWEMDLIEGKKGTNVNLLTMSERKSKMGIAVKIRVKSQIFCLTCIHYTPCFF